MILINDTILLIKKCITACKTTSQLGVCSDMVATMLMQRFQFTPEFSEYLEVTEVELRFDINKRKEELTRKKRKPLIGEGAESEDELHDVHIMD